MGVQGLQQDLYWGDTRSMSVSLSIYSQRGFREFLLPSIQDSDYSIELNHKFFGLQRDICLQMENFQSHWKILPGQGYRIEKAGQPIEVGDFLKVYVDNRVSVYVAVVDKKYPVTSFAKYLLPSSGQITFGSNSNNTISYQFRDLVSKQHGYIEAAEVGYRLVDTSTNGTYVNSKRVEKEHRLSFGDEINILGLHMIFLGNILAVDTNNHQREEKTEEAGAAQGQYPPKSAGHTEVVVAEDVLRPTDLWTDAGTIAIAAKQGKYLLHRAPMSVQKIHTEPIEIEAPPEPAKSENMPLAMVIGPAITMSLPMMMSCAMMILASKSSGYSGGLMMYTGAVMAVSSAVVTLVWSLMNQNMQKKKMHQQEIHRFEAYSRYLKKKTAEIREKYEHNRSAMISRYIPAEDCAQYTAGAKALWNRNSSQPDFLIQRIGKGDIPFQVPIKVPDVKFTMVEDSLNDKPQYIFENYKMLYDVPICVDLKSHRLVGMAGGEEKVGAVCLARALAVQLAATCSYTDLKMAFVYDKARSEDEKQWDFARWLPHCWSKDNKMRFIAEDEISKGDLFYYLAGIFRQRDEELGETKEISFRPHFVIFVTDPKLLEGELLAKYIFDEKKDYGLTTILLCHQREELPNACHFIIENTSESQGYYDSYVAEDDKIEVAFDQVGLKEAEDFARRLSNIEVMEVEEGGEVPNSITFFDMYGVKKLEDFNVMERWKKARIYDNIRGMLGVKSGGKECYLDVHEKYHGPHGLVAGTTGSGKSETLQTYMLSLAINYSPYDIGFFVIDYKGGGMANLFNGLPHLIGQISNLSGNQVHRAMVSIKSENRRRQQIFNDNGVNNINLYTKLFKNGEAKLPVPHLFIVIDEFAELKREEPDFMKELISVAQVGRSLGVHLVLATQKPAGTVDDNIWSNSKFRLCLRVQDKMDSKDMLHRPDAAYITQAGRGYLQVGNDEVFELFQSGYSGATYVEDASEDIRLDTAALLGVTGHEEIKGSYQKSLQAKNMTRAWVEKLLTYYKNSEGDIRRIYALMEQDGIDYPESAFNTKQLSNFCDLVEKARSLEGDVVENIMILSTTRGVKLPVCKEHTQLDAVIEYLAKVAKENDYNYDLQLWMPVLPEVIALEEFEEYREETYQKGIWPKTPRDELKVLMGKMDDPSNQAQFPLWIDIAESGHLAVCAGVASGKSTFIQTFIYGMIHRYDPDRVSFYIIDYSSKMQSCFEKAPHVGGVMYEGDDEKIAKCMTMMEGILAERKSLFHGGNFLQYVKANPRERVPAVFFVIDNMSSFTEKTDEKYMDFLIQLSKEGVSHGIYLVLSGADYSRAEIPNRIADNMLNAVAMQQADKFIYSDIIRTREFDVIPEVGIAGRGLARIADDRALEFQGAVAVAAEDDYQRLEKITEESVAMAHAWRGKRARPIPQIPERPTWELFTELEDVARATQDPACLPLGYDAQQANGFSVDLSTTYLYLIMGFTKSGKKNCMRALIRSALRKKGEVTVVDLADNTRLKSCENWPGVTYVTDDNGIYDMISRMVPAIQERNARKLTYTEQDYSEEEIFAKMAEEYEPIFVFISDIVSFVHTVEESEISMTGGFINIWEKGSLLNIYFFASIGMEEYQEIVGDSMFRTFCSYRKGIHFGGKSGENNLLNFDDQPYKERETALRPGVGLVPADLVHTRTRQVVLPIVKNRFLTEDEAYLEARDIQLSDKGEADD